jgi:hypothetical protein
MFVRFIGLSPGASDLSDPHRKLVCPFAHKSDSFELDLTIDLERKIELPDGHGGLRRRRLVALRRCSVNAWRTVSWR